MTKEPEDRSGGSDVEPPSGPALQPKDWELKPSSPFALPLALLRQELLGADLLPARYARYRPLLADGLCFFLERLPASRLERIFLEQSRMPAKASMAERIVALLHHVPTLHKLGQVVARDRRLDAGFRKWLQQLESLEPRTPGVVRLLDREFKGWRRARIEPGAAALAEGSVAVVLPFVWRGAGGKVRRQGVFKILKPGIEALLDQDLAIWGALGDFLGEDCDRYHLPQLDYRETFETVRDLLVHEVRLDEEQQHLAEAAKEYASLDAVKIPALLPFGSARLTAMERISGDTLMSRLEQDDRSVRALAPVIAQALIAWPVFSSRAAALFHADPHAGNLFVTGEGRLGILDWSLAGRLQKADRIDLAQLLLGALTLDTGRMQQILTSMSRSPPAGEALAGVLRRALRELRRGATPGVAWLTRLLDRVVVEAGVRLKPEFLLFRKTLLTLEGVLADLARSDEGTGGVFLDEALLGGFLRQFAAEWPDRFRRPLDSRAFNTHLSTGDLLGLLWSSPMIYARYWAQTWEDALDRSDGPKKAPGLK